VRSRWPTTRTTASRRAGERRPTARRPRPAAVTRRPSRWSGCGSIASGSASGAVRRDELPALEDRFPFLLERLRPLPAVFRRRHRDAKLHLSLEGLLG